MTDEQQFILAYVSDTEHLSYNEALSEAKFQDYQTAEGFYNSVQDTMLNDDGFFVYKHVGNGRYTRSWKCL